MNPPRGGEQVRAEARPTAAAWTAAWILLVCVLVGLTLDNTHPYQGDETYYIKSAIGMLKTGNLLDPQYDGVIRLQKPILAYWMTWLGYATFGISLWAGRASFLLASAALLVLAPSGHEANRPGYEILSRAGRYSGITRANGRFLLHRDEFVLLGRRR